MANAALRGTQFRFLAARDRCVSTSLADAVASDVVRGLPVRGFPAYRGQRNYPGWLWLSTMFAGRVRACSKRDLWLADFDPAVTWIASQPFWVSGRDGSTVRGDREPAAVDAWPLHWVTGDSVVMADFRDGWVKPALWSGASEVQMEG